MRMCVCGAHGLIDVALGPQAPHCNAPKRNAHVGLPGTRKGWVRGHSDHILLCQSQALLCHRSWPKYKARLVSTEVDMIKSCLLEDVSKPQRARVHARLPGFGLSASDDISLALAAPLTTARAPEEPTTSRAPGSQGVCRGRVLKRPGRPRDVASRESALVEPKPCHALAAQAAARAARAAHWPRKPPMPRLGRPSLPDRATGDAYAA